MDLEENEDGLVVISNVHGDICFRKARRKRQKKLVREMFFDYANNTTLHGLPYTTKKGLTLTEKIFWLITFIASICLCAYLINNVWIKWVTSPVIVTVSEHMVSVRKVPFPSVTICPQLKCKTTKYNYTAEIMRFQELMNKSDDKLLEANRKAFYKLDDLNQVCQYGIFDSDIRDFYSRNYSNADVARNILDVALQKTDVFELCRWGKDDYSFECNHALSTVLTSEGLCYNFNSLAANEILREENIHTDYPYLTADQPSTNWTVEHGYTDFGSEVYPRAGKENGAVTDLEVLMRDYLRHHDEICNVLYSGFKVYVQHPADLPQSSLYYYTVLNSQVSSMALSFSVLNTSETLRRYPAEIRQCYFPEERYLKYFKIYTANNCRLECLSNYTYNICNCVGFFMPRESSKRICTTESSECMEEAAAALEDARYNKKDSDCLCLPSCNSIDYEAEILKSDFNLKKLYKAANKMYNYDMNVNGTKYSKLEMYYKHPRFLSMRRSELFGLTDFLANIGGLLGLFLGFSFLSLVEIFYFLTLRLCCTLKRDLKDEKIQRRNTIAIPKKY